MDTSTQALGLASLGRNGDSVLVHMTPNEVQGLQALAQSQGTTLTTNPQTGLPEAFNLGGFFKELLPVAAGFGAALIPGLQPYALQAGIAAGALAGAATNKDDPLSGAITGGLAGFGGQGLATSALNFGSAAGAKAGATANSAASNQLAAAGVNPADELALDQVKQVSQAASGVQNANNLNAGNILGGADDIMAFNNNAGLAYGNANFIDPDTLAKPVTNTFGQNLQQAASNIGNDPMGFVKDNAFSIGAPLATAGLAGLTPEQATFEEDPRNKYDPNRRLNLDFDTGLRLLAEGGSIYTQQDSQMPMQQYGIGKLDAMTRQQSQMGMYAEGGALESGGFVIPADVVSHMGNGSSDAGLKLLAKAYKARPIKGDGDGMSDDIPTTIDGKEPARVAHEEAYIPREMVEQMGGPQAFYELMKNVRKARTGTTKQGRQIDPEDYLV